MVNVIWAHFCRDCLNGLGSILDIRVVEAIRQWVR